MIMCLSDVSSWYDVVTEVNDIVVSGYESEFLYLRLAYDETHKSIVVQLLEKY